MESGFCVQGHLNLAFLVGKKKNKTLQKQAYGFRDLQFFKLKILALHESKCVFRRKLPPIPEISLPLIPSSKSLV